MKPIPRTIYSMDLLDVLAHPQFTQHVDVLKCHPDQCRLTDQTKIILTEVKNLSRIADNWLGEAPLRQDPLDKDRLHMALGFFGEVGELSDAVKKVFAYGQDADFGNIEEELGDLLFYLVGGREYFGTGRAPAARSIKSIAILCGLTMESIIEANMVKLQKRYPEGFSFKAAKARADKGTQLRKGEVV